MKDFNDLLNSGISDEQLAAYIDGNTTESENALIENSLNGDSMLSEAYEIANDGVSFGSNFDWELHKGDFGFWELGLPPVVTEPNHDLSTSLPFIENVDIQLMDEKINDLGAKLDDVDNNDIITSDLNTIEY